MGCRATLRRRSRALLREIAGLPSSAWRTVELDVPARKYQTPRVYEQPVHLAGRRFRQLYIRDLGHDEPTILLTNDRRRPVAKLITRYSVAGWHTVTACIDQQCLVSALTLLYAGIDALAALTGPLDQPDTRPMQFTD